jgi:hypothetical protein
MNLSLARPSDIPMRRFAFLLIPFSAALLLLAGCT